MRIGTAKSTKILDSACVNEYKIPLIVMMENAVLSAFKHMDIENNQRYVIVSGVGNNGGDGLGLARQLTAHGKEVEVFIVGKIEKMSECSKINYNILKAMNISTNIVDEENLEYLKCSVKKSDIVVDCIFGTGLEREIKGIFYNVIDIINQNKNKTYSIDVPSGINATNGNVLGICIDADKTISFEFYKRGFLKYDVKQYLGEVIVEHIGIPEYILEKYDDREYITNLDLVKNNIKEKNKFKTEFLSNVAYDIKKPINKIFETNNNLIENKGKYNSENINNHTRLVKQNCYRLIRLLSNVEYVSRIDNGTCTLELRKCDIVKLLENIVKISKTYTDKKGIDISFKSEVNKKILSLDIDKVEKIILNILSNAIKFTDTGGKIDINLYMENEQVCISIKDTGIGIPKDKTEVIFENFEQLDTTLSRGCEGTGMGLSVVKKLANLNNIKINVESELNKGSEFIITLPNNIVSKNIKLQDKFAQDEKIDIEFSDIYLNLTS